MSSAKKTLRKFLKHIENAPPGVDLEVGLMWDQEHGWRVYQRIGDKALAMEPAGARKLADTYDKVGASPEWSGVKHGLEDTLGALRVLADEAAQKNIDKVIPDGAVAFSPAQGTA